MTDDKDIIMDRENPELLTLAITEHGNYRLDVDGFEIPFACELSVDYEVEGSIYTGKKSIELIIRPKGIIIKKEE